MIIHSFLTEFLGPLGVVAVCLIAGLLMSWPKVGR